MQTDRLIVLDNSSTKQPMAIPRDKIESIVSVGQGQVNIKMESGVGYIANNSFQDVLEKYENKKSPNRSNSK